MAIENGHAVFLQEIDPSKLKITRTSTPSTLPSTTSLPFGIHHSDHMLILSYDPQAGGWSAPEIKPYANISLDPMSSCFQYATSCFEGMKAYLSPTSQPLLFRPKMNMARLASSVSRLSLPPFDTSALLELIKKLVKTEEKWIPRDEQGKALTGYSLYVRPTMLGTKSSLGVGASDKAILYVICSPSGPFFPPVLPSEGKVPGYIKPVKLLAVSEHVRAWPGGTGAHKLALNYSPGFLTQKEAERKGYDQILWLRREGREEVVMEVGAMNFFVALKRDDGDIDIITPPLDGTILPGVTRASILQLIQSDQTLFSSSFSSSTISSTISTSTTTTNPAPKLYAHETPLTMSQLDTYHSQHKILEIFGVGTAAIVAPVGAVSYSSSLSSLSSSSSSNNNNNNNNNNDKEKDKAQTMDPADVQGIGQAHAANVVEIAENADDAVDHGDQTTAATTITAGTTTNTTKTIVVPEYEQGIGPVAAAIRRMILDIQEGRVEWEGWAVGC
ncbi:D-aminoacid aminotransferase-like PLP-dependent enzyme [Dendrothele bispora CBS 962.96]|uniref:Branched-chain-amino-acid aminotransferase n=1 Tax=Dendrothele bispora (strain CBS 962.96) TaxID=1314807 RepID=A0A4S8LNG8_DENBC|nr:D-aminoacid aminotransferase-like PLP-dependent enzyme [Dendrothele bispora CBS 962.96]